jgi:hypothetical protein
MTLSPPNETNFLAILFLFNSPHDGDGAWMGPHGMWGHGVQNIVLKLAMLRWVHVSRFACLHIETMLGRLKT